MELTAWGGVVGIMVSMQPGFTRNGNTGETFAVNEKDKTCGQADSRWNSPRYYKARVGCTF